MKNYFFISGLPRSGSTLLSAILLQNPDFYADIHSPICSILTNTIDVLTFSENNFSVNDDQRESLYKHIFEGYYDHIEKKVVFDTNREWTAKTSLLKKLYPYTKIICCVRDPRWILDSLERIAARNPYYTNILIDKEHSQCVTTRCDYLMDPSKDGQVIKPWYWMREGMGINGDMIYIMEYDRLCKSPKKVMEEIYSFINIPFYQHDFDNVFYENKLFDIDTNLKGLHTINSKVEPKNRKTILPSEIWAKYAGLDFWNNSIGQYA